MRTPHVFDAGRHAGPRLHWTPKWLPERDPEGGLKEKTHELGKVHRPRTQPDPGDPECGKTFSHDWFMELEDWLKT